MYTYIVLLLIQKILSLCYSLIVDSIKHNFVSTVYVKPKPNSKYVNNILLLLFIIDY